jgi:FtsH-binding integral membrane protein
MSIEPGVYSEIQTAADAAASERSSFIRRTYAHLAGAILAFVVIEYVILVHTPLAQKMLEWVRFHRFGWLVILGGFMAVGYIADRWARSDTSVGMQYVGLLVYVVAEAIIFAPLLFLATAIDTAIIPQAGLLTLTLFAGLTGTVFITRKDFSFMRGILSIGAFIALGLIVAAVLFGFSLGILFSVAMVGLAGGYILYYTSNIMRYYRTDQHVAAALALFAAVALMFWYIVRIFMSRD